MKKILSILMVFSLVFIYSCDDNEDFDTDDQLTGTAALGGAIVDVNSNSVGKLLGAPSSLDLDNATVNFSDSLLDLEMILLSGGQDVSSYEILKSFNGGLEITVATSNTMPISLNYTTLDEFLNGLGTNPGDLRIGDQIVFRTKFIHNDGRISFSGPNDGTYTVTINCSSNLVGNYGWGTYQPSLDLVEVAAGKYRMPYFAWFSGIYWMEFEDVCGELTITDWELSASYDVIQNEPGYVDSVTGDLIFPSVDVDGVSWYVGREMKYSKN